MVTELTKYIMDDKEAKALQCIQNSISYCVGSRCVGWEPVTETTGVCLPRANMLKNIEQVRDANCKDCNLLVGGSNTGG